MVTRRQSAENLTQSSYVETLRRVPLFADLSPEELEVVSRNLVTEHYSAGQTILVEGERGGDLMLVKEGSVKVVKAAPSGRQQLLSIERAGSSLGEVSVFDGGCYSASGIAADQVTLFRLRGPHFRKLCIDRPEVAMKVIGVLGHRLRRLRRLVEELSFSTVRSRLIAHLLMLAESDGRGDAAGGVVFALNENNEELASRLGTVRELISRNLGRLHGQGLVVMRRRQVSIPSVARLREELEQS